MSASPNELVLSVRHLTASFRTDDGLVTAVDDVSFDLRRGETLALVGESGCGKSVAAKSILRLLPEPAGLLGPRTEIFLGEIDLARADEKSLCRVRGAKLAMIFQEPMTALDPVLTVGWQVEEALRQHTALDRAGRRKRALEWLARVELHPERCHAAYPHQLSGGMRQRALIAMALCCEPLVLLADEPTSALDVTVEAQILALLADLQAKLGIAIVHITHDLGVVARVADRVCVLYAGRMVETGSVSDVFRAPQHPYTQALLRARFGALRAASERGKRLPAIEGAVPSLADLPSGCRFHPRCAIAQERCAREEPELVPHAFPEQPVRCHFPLDAPGAIP